MEAWPSQVRHLVLIQKITGSNPVASSIHAAVGKLAKSLRSDRRVLRVRLPSAAPFNTTTPVNSPGDDEVCKTSGNANKSTVGSSPTTGTNQRDVG